MQRITSTTKWPLVSKPYLSMMPDSRDQVTRPVIISGIDGVESAVKMAAILNQGLTQGEYSPYMPLAKAGNIAILELRVGNEGDDPVSVYRNTLPVASACLLVRQDGTVTVDFVRGKNNRELYSEGGDNSSSPLALAVMEYVSRINDRSINLISVPGAGAFRSPDAPAVQSEVAPEQQDSFRSPSSFVASAFSALRNAVLARRAAPVTPEPVIQPENAEDNGFEPIDMSAYTRSWPILSAEYKSNGLIIAPVQTEAMLRELALRTENRMMWSHGREETIAAIMNGKAQISAIFKDTGAPPTIDDVVGYGIFVPRDDRVVAQAIKSRHEMPPTSDMVSACSEYAMNISNGSFPSYFSARNNAFPVVGGQLVENGAVPQTQQYDENGILIERGPAYQFRPAPTLRREGFNAPVDGFATTDEAPRQSNMPFVPNLDFGGAPDDSGEDVEEHLDHNDDEVSVDDHRFPELQTNPETQAELRKWLPETIGVITIKPSSFDFVLDLENRGTIPDSISSALAKDGFHRADLSGLNNGKYLPIKLDMPSSDLYAIIKLEDDGQIRLVEAINEDSELLSENKYDEDAFNDGMKAALHAVAHTAGLQARLSYHGEDGHAAIINNIKRILEHNSVTVTQPIAEHTVTRGGPSVDL